MKNAGLQQPRNFDMSPQKKDDLCRTSQMDRDQRLLAFG
jgi:hypothetical protein